MNVIAGLAVAALTVALPGIAAAPTPGRNAWIPASCARGDTGTASQDDSFLYVPTAAAQCGTWTDQLRFGAVAFLPDQARGVVRTSTLRSYDGTKRTVLTAALPQSQLDGVTTLGVCVLRTPDDRLACVRVDRPPGKPLVSTVLATDDPLVDKPVDVVDDGNGPSPPANFCGTCVVIEPRYPPS